MWPEAWTSIGKDAQKREKQEWALEKPKLDNARRLRGICSIDPGDEEDKDIIENSRRKLERLAGSKGDSPIFTIVPYKTNVLMWGLFMPSTMKVAIHLGPNYTGNLEMYKNANFKEIQNLFEITQKLLSDSECEVCWKQGCIMDEIHISFGTSDQVDK